MWPFIVSTLRAGIRSKSIHAVLALGVLLIFVAFLAASFSMRQPMTVALDVGFSGLRFALMLLALFWALDLFSKEIDRKTIVFVLAYPHPRSQYLLGRFFGIVLLLLLAAIVIGLLLLLAVAFSGLHYEQEHRVQLGWGYWATVLGLWLDAVVVAAFALLIASLSTVTLLPLALGGMFAVGAKALGPVLDFLQRGADGDAKLAAQFGPIVRWIQWLLPDLSRLDWRFWPMYGVAPEFSTLLLSLGMALGYAIMMLALASLIFSRRELF